MPQNGCILALLPLLLALKFDSAYGACPNQCSGHGTCNDGNTCSCFEGWDPDAADCSRSMSCLRIRYTCFSNIHSLAKCVLSL